MSRSGDVVGFGSFLLEIISLSGVAHSWLSAGLKYHLLWWGKTLFVKLKTALIKELLPAKRTLMVPVLRPT